MHRFDFCSEATLKRPSENLGQVLFGERIEPSPYKVTSSINMDFCETYTLCVAFWYLDIKKKRSGS